MPRRLRTRVKDTLPIIGFVALYGGVQLLLRLGLAREGDDTTGAAISAAVLVGIVSASYLAFALLGYRVNGGHVDRIPHWLALLVVAAVTVAALSAMVATLFFRH